MYKLELSISDLPELARTVALLQQAQVEVGPTVTPEPARTVEVPVEPEPVTEWGANQGTVEASATTPPPATPATPGQTDPQGRELDKNGYYWDEAIHSKPPKTLKDGTWRKKRGIAEDVYKTGLAKQDAENMPGATPPQPAEPLQPSIFPAVAEQAPAPAPAPVVSLPTQQPPAKMPIPQPANMAAPTDAEVQAAQGQYTANYGPDATTGILQQYGCSSGTQLDPQMRAHLINFLTLSDQQQQGALQ